MAVVSKHRPLGWVGIPAFVCLLVCFASAGDLRINIPKRSKPTPVQKLNQDGVKEVQKHDYKKAKELFYKAYLIDPNDPFTLNNLGYIAELEGQVDRAQRYYALSQEQNSDAAVYKSTDRDVIGQPVAKIAGNAADAKLQVNRWNVYAMGLLQKDRAPEADLALQKALKLDPKNPFTLNNLGFAKEKEGELEEAYKYYMQAAGEHSDTPIVVTVHKDWRGKGISQIAERNAASVKQLMARGQDIPSQVARFNTRGVAAINRNDYKLARQYFQQAYKLDPQNAFALNNMGYLSELDGDRESADYYYAKAREADQSSMKVAYATRKDVEGMDLASVAGDSDDAVLKATEEAAALRRAQGGPVILRYRNNEPVPEPAVPLKPPPPVNTNPVPPTTSAPSGNGGLLQPLPENEQPPAAQPPAEQPPASQPNQGSQGNGGLLMPLPENQQPPAAQPPPASQPEQAPPQGNGGLLQPLPENQQPPAAQQPSQQPQQQQQNPPQQQPQEQGPPPQVANPQSSGGLLMPLPDNQQPPAAKQPPPAQPQSGTPPQ